LLLLRRSSAAASHANARSTFDAIGESKSSVESHDVAFVHQNFCNTWLNEKDRRAHSPTSNRSDNGSTHGRSRLFEEQVNGAVYPHDRAGRCSSGAAAG
jgi:hypothetical protein